MTREEAIEIIKIERECVERNTQNECDRDCINCDLLRTDQEIFYAYDMAIEALKEPKVGGWVPVADRLPNMEEYLENDGRFILDDGNRRYQGLFDIYDKKFKFSKHLYGLSYELIEDNCVIAWQPLPEPYKAGEQELE